MKVEQFHELATTMKTGWPPGRIIEDINKPDEQKLVLQCENGGYIKFALVLLSPDLLEDWPQMAIDQLHEKLLIQYTDDLKAPSYKNLGRHIRQRTRPEGRMGEALDELTFRIQLGTAFS